MKNTFSLKNKQSRIMLYLMLAIIAVISSLVATGAWFLDREDVESGLPLGAAVVVDLVGTGEDGMLQNFAQLYDSTAGAYPGDKILDTVSVRMGEKTEESVLRVQFGIDILDEAHEVKTQDLTEAETNLLSLLQEDLRQKATLFSSDWAQSGDWIYFKHLASGKTNIQIFDEYSLPLPDSEMDNQYQELSFRISLVAEAIQAANILTYDEWNTAITSLSDSVLLEAVLKYNGERFSAVDEVLPYIESTGTQYFDTKVVPTLETVVEATFSTSSFGTWLFGSRGSDGAVDTYAANLSTSNQVWFQMQNNSTSSKFSTSNYSNKQTTIKTNKDAVVVDGTQVGTIGRTAELTSEHSIYLGALNQNGSIAQNPFVGKIYSAKIWDNGKLVRHFVPARDKDGNVGLYDLVSAQMFLNAGSGNFSFGHSIIYMANGGTLDASSPKSFVSGDLPITLKNPTREGYEFDGWFLTSDYSGAVQTSIPAGTDSNVYLFAKWIKTYNISYHLGGGTNDVDNPSTFGEKTLPITLKNPTRDGYEFGGWFSNPKFSGDAVTQIAIGTTKNISLWAKWNAVEKSVSYVLNGGTNDEQNVSAWTILDAPLRLYNPTKEGMTFEGWFASSDFSGNRVTYLSKDMFGDVTLYAKWATTFSITYNLGGGLNDGRNPTTFTKNTETITLFEPTRVNYSFVGWFDNEALSGTAVTQIAKGTETNIVLWAKWNSTQITVSFDATGGSVSPIKQIVEKDGVYGDLPTPTKAGYTFDGWYLIDEGYTEIEYIESTGTQYIDTGYYWRSDNTRVILSANITETGNHQSLFGNQEFKEAGKSIYGVVAYIPSGSSGSFNVYAFNGGYLTASYALNKDIIVEISTSLSGTTRNVGYSVTQDGVTKTQNAKPTADSVITNPNELENGVGHIYLFANHNSGDGAAYNGATPNMNATQVVGGMKVYSFKMFDNGKLVRDFVPVVRTSDGAVGMLDLVEKKFYGNSGTGTFVAGPDGKITASSTVSTNVDHTLFAHWTENVYNITYNLDGGTNNAGNPATFSRTQLPILLLDATKSGEYFAGWYLDSAFTKRVTKIDGGTLKNVELWARFSAEPLVFDLVGSSSYSVRAANTSISGDIVIPSTHNGKSVVVVQNSAFAGCSNVTSVQIPTTVKSIGINAFENCTQLSSVTIPEGVTLVPNNAFVGCSELSEVNLPTSVESIGANAFAGCTKLTSVVLPSEVSEIGRNAFSACSTLATVEVYADTPATIKSGVFPSSVQKIYVKASSLSAYKTAWSEYASKIVAFPTYSITYNLDGGTNSAQNPTTFAQFDLPLTLSSPTKENADFMGWYTSSTFTGEPITEITAAQSVTLHARWDRKMTITYVLNGGTNNAANLTTISESMLPYVIEDAVLGSNTFLGWFNNSSFEGEQIEAVTKYGNITLYAKWGADYSNLFEFAKRSDGTYSVKAKSGATLTGDVIIPTKYNNEFVSEITSYGFSGYSEVTSFVLPKHLQVMGSYAFNNCSGLTSMAIPSSVTSIGEYSFSGCSSLTAIEIPRGVTNISSYMLYNCSSLTSIAIPDSVTTIKYNAFNGCSNVLQIYIPSSVTIFEYRVFYQWNSSAVIYCGAESKPSGWDGYWNYYGSGYLMVVWGVVGVAQQNSEWKYAEKTDGTIAVLEYLGTATNISIPSSLDGKIVTRIYNGCFENDTAITQVTIPSGVTSIGSNAFYNCTSLTTVTFSTNSQLASISSYAFYGCSGLTKVNITDLSAWFNIDFESSDANPLCYAHHLYLNNTEITELTIPSGVTTIKNNALYGASSLTSITIPSGVTSIGSNAFQNCTSLMKVFIPNSVMTISAPFYYCSSSAVIYCEASQKPSGWSDNWNYYGSGYLMVVWGVVGGPQQNDEWDYCEKVDGTIVVVKYRGDATDVSVPNSFGGKEVSELCSRCFENNTAITQVTIPSSVTSICSNSFSGCSGLTKVNITDLSAWFNIDFESSDANPLYYAHHLYLNNTEITELTIPSGVTTIKNNALYGASSLTSITIPSSVTSICSSAFANCTGLTRVYIPSSVTTISASNSSSSPFYGCNNSAIIYCGASSKPSGWGTYWNYCNSSYLSVVWGVAGFPLQSAEWEFVEKSDGTIRVIKYLGSSTDLDVSKINNKNISEIQAECFKSNATITNVSLGSGVVDVGSSAFYGCSNLSSINFQDGLKTIGSYAFYGCSDLSSINLQDGLETIGSYAFQGCSSLKTIVIPQSVESLGAKALKGCTSLESLTLPFVGSGDVSSGPNSVLGYLFDYQTKIKSYQNVYGTTVGSFSSFEYSNTSSEYFQNVEYGSVDGGIWQYSCFNANSSYKYESYTYTTIFGNKRTGYRYVNAYVLQSYFYFIPSTLKNLTILGGVINECSLMNCNMIENITIGPSVTSIGSKAFSRCSGLTKVNITDLSAWFNIDFESSDANPLCYAHHLYLNNTEITELTIPSGVTTIKNNALYGASSLTSITIPSGVTSIGSKAFYNCTSLATVTFATNSQLTNISNSAFYGCSGLTSIAIPSGVTSIGSNAFYNCTSLATVTFATNSQLTNIGYSAFYGCSGLTSIAIPSGVTSIGSNAFCNCTSLATVTFATNSQLTNIASSAFANCTGFTQVYIPSSVTTISADSYSYSPFYGCSSSLVIYCGASSKPSGWGTYWNYYDSENQLSVTWGASGLPES